MHDHRQDRLLHVTFFWNLVPTNPSVKRSLPHYYIGATIYITPGPCNINCLITPVRSSIVYLTEQNLRLVHEIQTTSHETRLNKSRRGYV